MKEAQHELAEEQKDTSRQLAVAPGSSLMARNKAALEEAVSRLHSRASPHSCLYSLSRDRTSQRDANLTQQTRLVDARHLIGAEHCVQRSGLSPGMLTRVDSMHPSAPLLIPAQLGDQQRSKQAAQKALTNECTAGTPVCSGDQHRTSVARHRDDAGDLISLGGAVHTAHAAGARGAPAPAWPVEARSNGESPALRVTKKDTATAHARPHPPDIRS